MNIYADKAQFLDDIDEHTRISMPLADSNREAPFNAYHILFMEPQIQDGIWSDKDFEIDEECLDIFCYAYNVWVKNKSKSLTTLFFLAMEQEKLPSWRSYVQAEIHDDANAVKEVKHFTSATIDEEADIKQFIAESTNQKNGIFPGTQLTALSNINKRSIWCRPYKVARKLDGIRHLLVLRNGKSYLLDRKMRVWALSFLTVPDCNSIFDAELLVFKDKSKSSIVILDVLVGTRNVMNDCLVERLKDGESVITLIQGQMHLNKADSSFSLQMQDYREITDVEVLLSTSESYPMSTDGLVFIPTESSYVVGYAKECFKWKSELKMTIDVRVEQYSDDIVELFVANNTSYVHFDYSSSPVLLEMKGSIVECYWDPDSKTKIPNQTGGFYIRLGSWRYVKMRHDKTRPNADWVANELKMCLLDPLTQNSLVSFLKTVKYDTTATFQVRAKPVKKFGRGRGRSRGHGYQQPTPKKKKKPNKPQKEVVLSASFDYEEQRDNRMLSFGGSPMIEVESEISHRNIIPSLAPYSPVVRSTPRIYVRGSDRRKF